jgi:hypothetical protein
MQLKDFIKKLQAIPNQELPVRVPILEDIEGGDLENLWVEDVEYSDKGQSGYEIDGEVRLIISA